jgi:2-isopropylmalate synthase
MLSKTPDPRNAHGVVQAQSGMQKGQITKYRPFPTIDLPDRQWPSRTINTAPIWCSVDLRDGNQALPIPMSVEEKLELFKLLVAIGFKEIEIGFPAASQIEFDFIRRLIDEKLIPDDVTVQVLVQAREELIRRTFEAIQGAPRVIIHLYNSTSPAQRKLVFGLDKPGIIDIATSGTRLIKELLPTLAGSDVTFQYSPESFALTEVDFALEICEAVVDVWQPTPEKKIILNLPETVEIATPNIYADQIEWFCRHLRHREAAIISVHTHNDRGTGVATTELGLLAGAERVEGTLFGNGERTGNVDIITVALNMYMQGVDPGLDFSNINAIRSVYEKCTRMDIHARHPYAGELVFTAFSGSHQDAIHKGMVAHMANPDAPWEVPYLPIDPKDIGRTYEAIIRINSQSGKGGVSYILATDYGFKLPKLMQAEFGKIINDLADATGSELLPEQIYRAFEQEYLQRNTPLTLDSLQVDVQYGQDVTPVVSCVASVRLAGQRREVRAQGGSAIDALALALQQENVASFTLISTAEQTLEQENKTRFAAYVQVQSGEGQFFGAAIEEDSDFALAKALLSALNRAFSANRAPATADVASSLP